MRMTLSVGLALLMLSLYSNVRADEDYDHFTKFAENLSATWSTGNLDAIMALYTDDVYYEDVTFGVVNHNKQELRDFAAGFFAAIPDATFVTTGTFIKDNKGYFEWTFTGTDVGLFKTGKRFGVRGVSPIELHHGKVSRQLDFYDLATMMRAVGLL
jgi:steroid delta-isomerase-like uncharacterized protein